MSKAEALITPGVLRWARERLGLDLATAAKQLGIKEYRLSSWENNESRPNIKQLFKFSEKYGQPAAVFYLPNPPDDELLPHDFRHTTDATEILDPQLVKEIRRVQRLREEALDLLEDLDAPQTRFRLKANLTDNPEEIGERLRELLGVSLEEQLSWKNTSRARKLWIDAIEQLGIFVFSAERIETKVFRGVSISGEGIPAILLNGKDSDAGRVFTLMHELGHLALHNAGICKLLDQPYKAKTIDSKTEWFCNRIAAGILTPKKILINDPIIKRANQDTQWPDEFLAPLALNYSVSKEAMLVRLLELGKTNWDHYASRRQEFHLEYERFRAERKKKKAVAIPYKYRILNRNGRAYTKLVFSALHEGQITTADLASLTKENLKHMGSVEKELFGRTVIFGHGA